MSNLKTRIDRLTAKTTHPGAVTRIVERIIDPVTREALCEIVVLDRDRSPSEWPDLPRDADGRYVFPEVDAWSPSRNVNA